MRSALQTSALELLQVREYNRLEFWGPRWDALQGSNHSDSGVLSRGFATQRGAHIGHSKFQSVALPYLLGATELKRTVAPGY